MLFAASAVPAFAYTDYAYYPFSGDATDHSGNGYDGTVNGATLCDDRLGNSNSAYSFDGNDYIVTNGSPQVSGSVTFSAWVYLASGGNGGYILNKSEYLTPGPYSLGITTDEWKRPNASVCIGSGESWVQYTAMSDQTLAEETWTYLEGIYDSSGGRLTLYINGLEADHVDVSGLLYQNSKPLYIGCDLGNSGSYFEGRIDEVLVTPEPATLSLLALGGAVLLRRRRRHK